MTDRKQITDKLVKALYLTSDVLEQHEIADLDSYIHAHEWGIFYRHLCNNIIEYDRPISTETYDLLKDISQTLGMDFSYRKYLEELITDRS